MFITWSGTNPRPLAHAKMEPKCLGLDFSKSEIAKFGEVVVLRFQYEGLTELSGPTHLRGQAENPHATSRCGPSLALPLFSPPRLCNIRVTCYCIVPTVLVPFLILLPALFSALSHLASISIRFRVMCHRLTHSGIRPSICRRP